MAFILFLYIIFINCLISVVPYSSHFKLLGSADQPHSVMFASLLKGRYRFIHPDLGNQRTMGTSTFLAILVPYFSMAGTIGTGYGVGGCGF